MKKSIFLSLMLLLPMVIMSQTRKVAILETVDREKTLSYGIKLMIRGQLAEAVTNTPGYEAYDRTNLQQIFDEQEFQRTGFVSEEDIKKIGEMTGVQYVLVAEAGKIDANTIVIDAKILNVETARVVKSANVMTQSDAASLPKGAQDLTSRLLANVKSDDTKMISAMPLEGAYIQRLSSNEYSINGKLVNRKEYYQFVKDNRLTCVPAYQQFKEEQKKVTAGWSLLGTGVFFALAGGTMWAIDNYGTDWTSVGLAFISAGVVLAGISVPLLAVGYSKMNNVYQLYNESCVPKKTASVTLNLQSSRNGLGLALYF